jgi:hypothetical protein
MVAARPKSGALSEVTTLAPLRTGEPPDSWTRTAFARDFCRILQSAEPPPICPHKRLAADPKSGIHCNCGIVDRTLVGSLGGDLLTGLVWLCSTCRLDLNIGDVAAGVQTLRIWRRGMMPRLRGRALLNLAEVCAGLGNRGYRRDSH